MHFIACLTVIIKDIPPPKVKNLMFDGDGLKIKENSSTWTWIWGKTSRSSTTICCRISRIIRNSFITGICMTFSALCERGACGLDTISCTEALHHARDSSHFSINISPGIRMKICRRSVAWKKSLFPSTSTVCYALLVSIHMKKTVEEKIKQQLLGIGDKSMDWECTSMRLH